MPDRISRFRVARLSLYPPHEGNRSAPYALIASTIKNGIPSAQILVDGRLPALSANPTTEEILEGMDAAIRQHMLR
jgi:hypothetical protein